MARMRVGQGVRVGWMWLGEGVGVGVVVVVVVVVGIVSVERAAVLLHVCRRQICNDWRRSQSRPGGMLRANDVRDARALLVRLRRAKRATSQVTPTTQHAG